MSGHSKWSTIKRKKGAADAKRSKMFSKLIKEISVAVKDGGGDEDSNPSLRVAIANAKGINMPKDNILRAIKKADDKDAANFDEVTYEGYAVNGIGVFVECLTDNLQRTVSSVRAAFTKYNGSLGKNGSLGFVFDRMGVFSFAASDMDIEELELEIIDAGAEEIDLDDGMIIITTAMEDFGLMSKKLDELKIEVESAKLQRIPASTEKLNVDDAKLVIKLIEVLEDDDDVQEVYHNLEFTEDLISAYDL
ncbi:MAG: YebC/PmpR family DNA-binding transcriptional regulator [Bacteroidales bacterium]|nr:YebC/PmpR family DNA-binding transcriptional regulator [Bacteroidales bacterium]